MKATEYSHEGRGRYAAGLAHIVFERMSRLKYREIRTRHTPWSPGHVAGNRP